MSRKAPTVGGSASPWKHLRRDPIVRIGAVLFGVLILPFLFPIFTTDQLTFFSESVVDLALLALAMAAFQYGLRRIDHPEQRRFWHYLTVAFGIWLVVRCYYLVLPDLVGTLAGDLTGDLLYLIFYLFLVLASLVNPHLRPGWSSADPTHRIERVAAILFVFSMLAYFAIVPSIVNYEAYDTWLPSLYMYVVLDGCLVFRFAYLRRVGGRSRYRSIYGLLSLTATWWLLTDGLECLAYAGFLEL